MEINGSEIKSGYIVDTNDEYSYRKWIALYVSKKDIKNGMNCSTPGLYLFGGYWYGRNPNKTKSYGKIIPIEGNHRYTLIHSGTWKLNNKYLKSIL